MLVEWQPILGCSYASPGCRNCKAIELAPPGMKEEFVSHELLINSKEGLVWTGKLEFSNSRLVEPFAVKKPTAFQVNPHGDLFHENTPSDWIDRVFEVMEACSHHFFQVLTKRAVRMAEYVRSRYPGSQAPANLAFGVSAERQEEINSRTPLLLNIPCSTRYLTLYPLLERIDLTPYLADGLHQVLIGQEPENPADPRWVKSLIEQCSKYNVTVLVSSILLGADRGRTSAVH